MKNPRSIGATTGKHGYSTWPPAAGRQAMWWRRAISKPSTTPVCLSKFLSLTEFGRGSRRGATPGILVCVSNSQFSRCIQD